VNSVVNLRPQRRCQTIGQAKINNVCSQNFFPRGHHLGARAKNLLFDRFVTKINEVSHVTLMAKKLSTNNYVSNDLFWCGMSRKCASAPCIFETPTTCQGGRFWHEMSTLMPLCDLSYNAVGPIFCIFIHNGSLKKTAKFQLFIEFRSNLAFGSKWRKVQFARPLHSLQTSPACNWSLTGPIFINFSHNILLSIPLLQFG